MAKTYNLRDGNNQEVQSASKGSVGGHVRLKIYGRLDCQNALRWIDKGFYVKHRVFFANEQTAQAAGFRPCGCCMKNEYKAWKEARSV